MKKQLKETYRYYFMFRGLFFLCLLTGFSHIAFSQHYHFRNIAASDGIQSNFVYRTFEDHHGYLWYLTDKGISRFDGKGWKYFSSQEGYEDVGAFHIAEDKDGIIWILTTNFKLYRYNGQRFYRTDNGNKIAWIDIDAENKKWVLTRLGKVFNIDPDFRLTPYINDRLQYRKDDKAYTMIHLGKEKFLLSGLYGTYWVAPNKPTVMITKNSLYNIPRVFKRLNGHTIVVGNNVMYDFDPNTEKLLPVFDIKHNEIISFIEDPSNKDIWIGTFHGIYYFRSGIISKKNVQVFLDDKIISSIIKSSNGNFYFSTFNKGVFACNFLAKHFDSQEGVPDEITPFIKKENNTIYLFTFDGKIFYLNGNKFERFRTGPKYIGEKSSTNNVLSIHDSIILIQSNKHYVLYKKKIYPFPLEIYQTLLTEYNKSLPDYLTAHTVLICDTTNPLLNAPFYHRFYDFLTSKNIIREGYKPNWAIGNEHYFLPDSGLAKATWNGRSWKLDFYPLKGLISSLTKTSSGTLVLGTYNKGILFIKGKNKLHIGSKEGLASNYCSKVILHKGYIWTCTNKGLSRILLNKHDEVKNITNFTADNYLLDNEVGDLLFEDDKIYVATEKGVSVFLSEAALPNNYPDILIENIQINNKDTIVKGNITLPYNQNNINIFYKSPCSESSEGILYKYIVSGNIYDTVYTTASDIRYGSLSPGNYTFTIWARNNKGLWSLHPAKISFTIFGPVWKRWWFLTGVAVFVFSLAFLMIMYRINLFKKHSRAKAKLVESELKALRLQMNPHFIFNTLNSLQKFILQHEPIEANKYIAKFSKLMRWIMIYSDKQFITLQEELEFLNTYIELEQLRFKKVFLLYTDIDSSIVPSSTFIPSLVIQPFIENAIKYGLTEKENKGTLLLKFHKNERYIHAVIQDNGVGRKKAAEEQHFMGKEFESTGIKSTSERLNLLLDEEYQKKSVIITDLYDPDGKAAGTKVELKIPYYTV